MIGVCKPARQQVAALGPVVDETKTAPLPGRSPASRTCRSRRYCLSIRGVVPVFRRPNSKPISRRQSESRSDANSPALPAAVLGFADVDEALKKRAGRDDNTVRAILDPGLSPNPGGAAAFDDDVLDHRLPDIQAVLCHHHPAHHALVKALIDLRPQSMHGRPFAGVEHTDVRVGCVGGQRLLAAEGIYLPHQMPLGRAADAAVARHVGDCLYVDRNKQGLKAHPRRSQRGLAARMTRPDYYDVVVFHGNSIIAHGSRAECSTTPFPRLKPPCPQLVNKI